MANILYAQTAFVCAVALVILLVRIKTTQESGPTKAAFIRLLVLSTVFCLVDTVWGLFASHTLIWDRRGLLITTYAFHGMSAFAAFSWLWFTLSFYEKGLMVTIEKIIAFLLLGAQLILLASNVFTGKLFYITDEPIYYPLEPRSFLFYLQMANYLLAGVTAFFMYNAGDKRKKRRMKNVMIFAAVAIFAGFFQKLAPDMPMYSCGFCLSCLTIFAYLITREQAELAVEKKVAEERASLLNALSGIFFAMYHYDLEEGTAKVVRKDENIASQMPYELAIGSALKMFETYDLRPDVAEANRDFWDFSTIDERFAENDILCREIDTIRYGWVQLNLIPYKKNEAGKITSVLWMTRIIDDEKKKEIELKASLEKALKDAKRADAAKTDFLSRMSHDIRTPMNGIIGMTRLAKKSLDDREKLADCLKKISLSADHLLMLINDILELSRIESGKTVMARELANLDDIIDVCVSVMDSSVAGRNLKTDLVIDHAENPYVYTDALRMRQVIMNIISNAVKYTPDGGSIELSFNTEKIDENHIRAFICLKDTGIGMSKEFIGRIYEPFAQEDEHGARTKYKGTGLGMAIVKEMMELFGGEVSIESEQNKGTKVSLMFPLESAPAPVVTETPEESRTAEETLLTNVKVLIVEDNELNREVARELLTEGGLILTFAVDGQDAVDKFRNSPVGEFDCILMDVMMPNMNGYEATNEIRSMNRSDAATVPIIALTANAFAEDIEKCREAGMNGHLSKPIEPEKVYETLRQFLPRKE